MSDESRAKLIMSIHELVGVPLSEATKAYDLIIEYFRLKSNMGDHPEKCKPREYILVEKMVKQESEDKDEERELINRAVKALEALFEESNRDTISRYDGDKTELVSKKNVIKLIDEWNAISFYEANEFSKECYYDIRNTIIAMQPVASCSDAISREAVLSIIDEGKEDNADEWMGYPWKVTPNLLMDEMRKLPPVAPRQRTGHWILVSDKTPGGYWKCSECLMHKRMPGRLDSFCSCCGADMREESEEDR